MLRLRKPTTWKGRLCVALGGGILCAIIIDAIIAAVMALLGYTTAPEHHGPPIRMGFTTPHTLIGTQR